jgi:hyperosmotically inducible periplasmic protein
MSALKRTTGLLAVSVFLALMAASPTSFAAEDSSSMKKDGGKDESAINYIDDAAITAKAKAELATASDLDASDIHVTTTRGIVTLSGTVNSGAQKEKAMVLVKKIDGVKDVTNVLAVRGGLGSSTGSDPTMRGY